MKFYYVANIFDLHIFDNETTALSKFFEISMEMHFASLFSLNERDITTSFLMIHLKCTVVHYSNLNPSSINNPLSRDVEYATLFFSISLTRLLSKTLWKNYFFQCKFPKFISRCTRLQNIKMSKLVILKWKNIRENLKKRPLLFRSEIGIFDIFFKRLHEVSFEDLQLNSNWKFQTRATMSHKMASL